MLIPKETLPKLIAAYIAKSVLVGKPAEAEVEIGSKRYEGTAFPVQEKGDEARFDIKSPRPYFIFFIQGKGDDLFSALVSNPVISDLFKALANSFTENGFFDLEKIVSIAEKIGKETANLPPQLALVRLLEVFSDMTGGKFAVAVSVEEVSGRARVKRSGSESERGFGGTSVVIRLTDGEKEAVLAFVPINEAARIYVEQARRWSA